MSNVDDNPRRSVAEARVGQVLRDKYRLDQLIGIGGMAAVYAATHRNASRVALKLLHPALSADMEIRKRFLREGYVANTVNHPGAVNVIDDDITDDGAVFLVMELLDGASVDSVWERAGFSLDSRIVLSIAHGLLDVLSAAHEKGIVHRDVKPDNVFVTRDGVVKLLDFGIARLRDASSSTATRTGNALGTPAFMSPEQAMGKASAIDGLTDVFAAGAVMFSLLSGRYVQDGESANELMVYAAVKPARPLASVAPQIAPPVAQIVDKALAFEKARRWQSAARMRDEIALRYSELFAGVVLTGHALAQAVFAACEGPAAITGAPESSPHSGRSLGEMPPVILAPGEQPVSHRGNTLTYGPIEQAETLDAQKNSSAASMSKITPSPQITRPASRWPPTTNTRKISSPVLIAGGSAGLLLAVGIATTVMITRTKNPVISEAQAVGLTAPPATSVAPPVAAPAITATAQDAVTTPAPGASASAPPATPSPAPASVATKMAIVAQPKVVAAPPASRKANQPSATAPGDLNPLGHQ